jgi:hypothetical protein
MGSPRLNFAEQCFRGRMNTFQGCACQGLAFVWAARGRYAQAAERYRLALAHVEANESQIGLPPAPCVALILVGLIDDPTYVYERCCLDRCPTTRKTQLSR